MAVIVAASTASCAGQAAAPQASEAGTFARELFDGANAERVAGGLAPLEWQDCVASVAVERAEAVRDSGTLEHQPLQAPCAAKAMAGENLSLSSATAAEVVARWMESPGHEANIMSDAYITGAVGCAADDSRWACSWLGQGPPVDAG